MATICAVLAVQIVRAKSFYSIFTKNKKYKNTNLPEVIDHLEGKPATIYEVILKSAIDVKLR